MATTRLQKKFPNYPFWKDHHEIGMQFTFRNKKWHIVDYKPIKIIEKKRALPYVVMHYERVLARFEYLTDAQIFVIGFIIKGEQMSEDSFG